MLIIKMNRVFRSPQDKQARTQTRIICAKNVDIFVHRPIELKEVAYQTPVGDHGAFYVADLDKGRPEGFADEVEFWDCAYIENETGATTEVVRLS